MVVLRMTNQQEELFLAKVDRSAGDCNVKIGDRVQVGNHRASVKYIGAVPPTKGLWLGLDWDNPSRGKHDGTYAGIRYFHARYPTSGSLVRLEKVQLGQTICEAIKDRYGGPGQVMSAEQIEEIRRALNTPFLELVGLDRPANDEDTYSKLNVVGVAEYRVSTAGEFGELAKLCPVAKELDLARNLISSWKTVADIAAQLPYLRFLDVSENRLECDATLAKSFSNNFRCLITIILSRMEFTWDDVLCCAQMWPQIEKFQVSCNNITTLSVPPPELFYNLRLLNIEGNNIRFWNEIEKLGHLPKLECLNACLTGLTSVSISDSSLFPRLRYILLSDNYINNWKCISELSKLKSLEELKFRQNPVLEGITRESARQMIIARIPSLKILNLQDIEPEERRGAEIDYLKKYARDWIKTAGDDENRPHFLIQHPIYPVLVNRYGEIDIGEISNTVVSLKSRLININLVYNEMKLTKKVPDTMLVSTLSALALTRFMRGLPRSQQPQLVLVSSQDPNLRIPLDDSMKSLSFYSIEDGDTVMVE